MAGRPPRDLNGDGKIDKREIATGNLGLSAIGILGTNKDGLTSDGTCINKAGVSKHYLDMFEHNENEVIEAEIRKHPIGLIAIWSVTIIVILIVWITVGSIAWFRNDIHSGLSPGDLTTAGVVLGLFVTILALLIGYVAAFLYINTLLIVTSEKLVQIRYISLFNRKVSTLSIGEVQDTTAQMNGILPTIFGYGLIVIESAGEQNNYNFTLARNPNKAVKTIVDAHEASVHKYGN